MEKIPYRLFCYYRKAFGFFYRGCKKLLRKASAHHTHTGCLIVGRKILKALPDASRKQPSKDDLQRYRNKWGKVSSNIPVLYMHLFPSFSGVDSADYVPDTLFFTHVEPMLNNVEYSRSFADKNLYSLLVDKSVLPEVLLRKIHGSWFDGEYNRVVDTDKLLEDIAIRHSKVIIKHAVASQGGDNIVAAESDGNSLTSGGAIVNAEWLNETFGDNFLLQAYVSQHVFYKRFNASSLNTLRVYTYRSVIDDSVHVLSAMLRVGGEGSVVDNISKGGKACGINSEGRLNGNVCDVYGNFHNQVGQVNVNQERELYMYQEVTDKARELAGKQFYTRLIGFDFCVDKAGEVKLIELNNYDVGVDILQMCNGPLFGEFTDEIIDYCQNQKKHFRFVIR